MQTVTISPTTAEDPRAVTVQLKNNIPTIYKTAYHAHRDLFFVLVLLTLGNTIIAITAIAQDLPALDITAYAIVALLWGLLAGLNFNGYRATRNDMHTLRDAATTLNENTATAN